MLARNKPSQARKAGRYVSMQLLRSLRPPAWPCIASCCRAAEQSMGLTYSGTCCVALRLVKGLPAAVPVHERTPERPERADCLEQLEACLLIHGLDFAVVPGKLIFKEACTWNIATQGKGSCMLWQLQHESDIVLTGSMWPVAHGTHSAAWCAKQCRWASRRELSPTWSSDALLPTQSLECNS
jgi:hypothetical protein